MKLTDHFCGRSLGLAIVAALGVCACGDDDAGPTTTTSATGGSSGVAGSSATTGGSAATGGSIAVGGTSTGGSSSTTGGINATGGTSNGGTSGAATGGTSTVAGASSTTGGTVNTSGGTSAATGGATNAGASATGGVTSATGGTSAIGGTSPIGGTASTGGASSSGGTAANTGGLTGAGGGSAASCPIVYDFENTTADTLQGWTADTGVTLGNTSTAAVTGSHALKATLADLAEGSWVSLAASPTQDAELWPGSVVTLHVMIPAGSTGVWMQAFTQSNNWSTFDTTGNSAVTVTPGEWTSWTYTIPDTFPGGLQALGLQIGVNAGGHLAAGDVYIDSISACTGPAVCNGNGTSSYDWEKAGSEDGWTIDGDATPSDTELAQSIELAVSGAGSLKVTFANLPADSKRRIVIDKPNLYCGQVVTFNVYVPGDFGADIELQPFASIDGWVWNPGLSMMPSLGAWNTLTYTVPQISSLGVQRLGLEISSAATASAYSGSIYIDDVSWGG